MTEHPRTPSRRDFMKTSAAVVGGTLASGLSCLALTRRAATRSASA